MAEPIETAIEEIVNVLRGVDGIKSVPINPPETMSYETFIIVYPFSGTFDLGPIGTRKGLHIIAVDLLVKRTDLAKNFSTLKTLLDPVAVALISEFGVDVDGQPAGNQFNDAFETFSDLAYSWTSSDYGGVPVVGYHFVLNNVKILVDL